MHYSQYIGAFLCAFGTSALLTALIIRIAYKANIVAQPKANRWHQKPTALIGGVGIFLAFTIVVLTFVEVNKHGIAFLVGSTLIFLLGLIDDIKPIVPQVKLAVEVIAGIIIIGSGIYLYTNLPVWLNWIMTLIWVVGLTNAFNLLDNMDGLSAGTAIIAGFFLFVHIVIWGNSIWAMIFFILCGATAGFLIFNINPAKIFMGDCGSLFLGYTLSIFVITAFSATFPAGSLTWPMIGPFLFVALPVIDTVFVSVLRKLNGRPVSQGGRDHISHRLVAIGFSERQAVLILYIFSIFSGITGLLLCTLKSLVMAMTLFILIILASLVFTIYLAQVPVYPKNKMTTNKNTEFHHAEHGKLNSDT